MRRNGKTRIVNLTKHLALHIGKMSLFYLGFPSQTFTIHRTAGKGTGYIFNSFLTFPHISQVLRHYLGDCCREFASVQC